MSNQTTNLQHSTPQSHWQKIEGMTPNELVDYLRSQPAQNSHFPNAWAEYEEKVISANKALDEAKAQFSIDQGLPGTHPNEKQIEVLRGKLNELQDVKNTILKEAALREFVASKLNEYFDNPNNSLEEMAAICGLDSETLAQLPETHGSNCSYEQIEKMAALIGGKLPNEQSLLGQLINTSHQEAVKEAKDKHREELTHKAHL